MKRLISVVICAAILLAFTACTADKSEDEKNEKIEENEKIEKSDPAEDYIISFDYKMESKHFSVSPTMMNYYALTLYYKLTVDCANILEYYGLDLNKPLDEQNYTDTMTWEQYFMNMTKTSVKKMLLLCEGAKDADISLSKEDKAEIDETMKGFETTAKTYGMPTEFYIKNHFCGPTEKEVKKCLEYTALAEKFAAQFEDPEEYDKVLKDLEKKYIITDTSNEANVDIDVSIDTSGVHTH